MPALNRAWLPGHTPGVTGVSIAAVLDHARSRGVTRLFVHCPPWATPDGFRVPGARPVTPMIKLCQPANLAAEASSSLQVRAIEPSDRQLFGDVAAQGNEAPPFMADGFNSTVGQEGWRHYLAFEGDTPIAAAAVRFQAAVAWC